MRFLLFAPMLFLTLSSVGQVQFEEVFQGLRRIQPTELAHAGDSSGRIFVATKEGMIRIYRPSEPRTVKTFLNITNKTQASGEQGLLGLTFHPDYESNGYFYVNYVAQNPRRTIISRFQVSNANPDKADSLSELILLTISQPFSNHNGGKLDFGPDGYLYIATGDGGSGNDPQRHGQNLNSLLGKILRIDVNSQVSGLNYAIPADNPFVNSTNAKPEIYAYGLRNPWRFSFDPETGRCWIGDVGQNQLEEIDTLVAGGNYGWRIKEGTRCTSLEGTPACADPVLINPVFEYGRANNDVSVTGGFVYRGPSAPTLTGKYIFGDYASGRIWSLQLVPGGPPIVAQLGRLASLSTFGQDENGDIYALNHNTGAIYKIKDNTVSTKPTASQKSVPIRVLPIPAQNEILITLKQGIACGNSVQIRDLKGDLVKRADLGANQDSKGEKTTRVDVSGLRNGTYFATTTCGKKTYSTKFLIAR